MTKQHIILPTNTSDLNVIKKVLDYFFTISYDYNKEDFISKTGYETGTSHKITFLIYFNLLKKNSKNILFKELAYFVYFYWENEEIRNELLILSWLYTKLPEEWNSINKPSEENYIISNLFKIIIKYQELSYDQITSYLKTYLSDEINLSINIEDIILKENTPNHKVDKILIYFNGILKNLNILNKDKILNVELLRKIDSYIKDLDKYNYDTIILKKIIQKIITKSEKLDTDKNNFILKNNNFQKIIYGAPGTGKSYFLSKEANEKFASSNIERVTFYDGYSYGQFVGMYKPASDDENNIIYKYTPGPLMSILVRALNNPEENYCLIIEEINRAKADKVFGNIFQLLDRNSNGESRYKISVSEEQGKYLTKEGINIENGLYLPKNLYIWATMNSADEGVQPLDTAFKRRWKFKYMSLNEKEEEFLKSKEEKELVAFKIGAENISWNKFRKVLNSILSSNHITEDKLLAPFFISPSDFEEDIENIEILNQDVFIEKVLMYIYDDLLRHYPKAKKEIFSEEIKTFSDIYEKSKDSNFEDIFNDSFKEKINS